MPKKSVLVKPDKKPSRSSLFSAKTEYACVALLELALHHNDPTPLRLKAISDKHGISHRFLVQILLQLKSAGLVASTRGASGGYHLGRPPDRITIADIVNVIDPPEPMRPDEAETAPRPRRSRRLGTNPRRATEDLGNDHAGRPRAAFASGVRHRLSDMNPCSP